MVLSVSLSRTFFPSTGIGLYPSIYFSYLPFQTCRSLSKPDQRPILIKIRHTIRMTEEMTFRLDEHVWNVHSVLHIRMTFLKLLRRPVLQKIQEHHSKHLIHSKKRVIRVMLSSDSNYQQVLYQYLTSMNRYPELITRSFAASTSTVISQSPALGLHNPNNNTNMSRQHLIKKSSMLQNDRCKCKNYLCAEHVQNKKGHSFTIYLF